MKFLKKPIFIKKIRFYNNSTKLKNFCLENNSNFIPRNNIIKSSYLEKVIDFNNSFSNLYLKGGYFYSKNKISKHTYFTFNKNELLDSYTFKNEVSAIKDNYSVIAIDNNNTKLKIKFLTTFLFLIVFKKSPIFLFNQLNNLVSAVQYQTQLKNK